MDPSLIPEATFGKGWGNTGENYQDAAWRAFSAVTTTLERDYHSGPVLSAKDLCKVREQCLAEGFGGFLLLTGTANDFGEVDDPPKCFFYRVSQTELVKSIVRAPAAARPRAYEERPVTIAGAAQGPVLWTGVDEPVPWVFVAPGGFAPRLHRRRLHNGLGLHRLDLMLSFPALRSRSRLLG